MSSRKSQGDIELARRMRAVGVPLELPEDDDSKVTQPPAKGISIQHNAEGIAEAIGDTSTGYILDVCIIPNVPWPIEIARVVLHLPWDDPFFQWIPDPSERGAEMYSLPGTSLHYGRDQVINHRIGQGQALSPGRSLSGILLGCGMDMPRTVLHGSEIPAFLHIFDQFGREYSAGMPLRVHRLNVPARPRKSARKPLFSCSDSK